GGTTLLLIPRVARMYDPETGANFGWLVALLGAYAVAYLPTIALASSLTFRHLPDPDRQFGSIRLWGTVGWVLAGLVLSIWLGQRETIAWLDANWATGAELFRAAIERLPEQDNGDSFRIGAVLSFTLVAFCFTLPPTPPAKADSESAIAPLEAAKLFKNRTFCLMLAISFLMAAIVPTYAFAAPKYLVHLGFESDWVPAVMTIGQVSEFPALVLLSACLSRFGMKATFAIGMAAWLARYIVFALDSPMWLILVGVSLHGVCHVFLVIVIQLFVDERCPEGAKASAQNIFAFLTMGIALPIGFVASGLLGSYCQLSDPASADYAFFFLVPAVIILLLLVIYLWGSNKLALGRAAHPELTTKSQNEPDGVPHQ
ncbi:MAG: MFS transporter, partial [Planctomycetota bacterium]|nr:MFS transporter [Planctomycetota bacterium]